MDGRSYSSEAKGPGATSPQCTAGRTWQQSSLLRQRKGKLLDIKEENYIKANAYEQEIASLNSKIKLLEAINTPTISEDNKNQTQLGNKKDTPDEQSQFTYEIENGTVIISGYKGTSSEVLIPQKIDGMPVVAIGEAAFKGSTVKKITLGEGLTYVDWFAFSDCKALKEIYIPSSVGEICHGAFDNCSSSLLIVCAKDSYAERYAQSWGIRYEAK